MVGLAARLQKTAIPQGSKARELRRAPKYPILVPIAPIMDHRPRDVMAQRNLGQCHALTTAVVNDQGLRVICPTATPARVRDL